MAVENADAVYHLLIMVKSIFFQPKVISSTQIFSKQNHLINSNV